MNTRYEQIGALFRAYCNQLRYRTAWIIGAPLTGKTTLARQLCTHFGWRYLNYTLDEGYFDQLQGRLETYQPEDLCHELRRWSAATTQTILIVDELDALLSCWQPQQRRSFVHRASRLPELPCGLILVSNLFEATTLESLLPPSDRPAYVDLSGVSQ